MQMDEGLDTGPVCLKDAVTIPPDMTAGQLHDSLSTLGASLIVHALTAAEQLKLSCTAQSEKGITYAHKVAKSEAQIQWNMPVRAVCDHIRGLSPFPGAWFETPINGKIERIKILLAEPGVGNGSPGTILDDQFTIACADGAIPPLILQRAGRKQMALTDFLRGAAMFQ